MKISFFTLGCKVNQFETQAMERILLSKGHKIVPFSAETDCFIINTCAVTAMSDKKSRQAIHHARRTNPNAVVAVCGCFSQHAPESAAESGADIICGTDDKKRFIELIESAVRGKQVTEVVAPELRKEFERLDGGSMDGRTRAVMKVEDGCNNFCAYCIIPYTRGRVRSLPMEEAVAEAKRLASEGYREIVVTGIEVCSYGCDLPGKPTYADLIAAICASVPEIRIRMGSIYPNTADNDFCKKLSKFGNFCQHFHLSLQSGCDKTLRRMNRHYTTEDAAQAVGRIFANFENPSVTADLITGFPGETEEEFAETLAFLREFPSLHVHIFPYSVRPGTVAERLPDQVDIPVRSERAATATKVMLESKKKFLESQIGRELEVLFETKKAGVWHGSAKNYADVCLTDDENLRNRVICVRAVRVEGDQIIAERI